MPMYWKLNNEFIPRSEDPADGINIVDICQTYFNHFLTPFDTVSTCMGRLIKWTNPRPTKYPCDFRDVGKKSSQNGEKMPMTNAERNQNLQKQTAMGEKSVSSQQGVNPSMTRG